MFGAKSVFIRVFPFLILIIVDSQIIENYTDRTCIPGKQYCVEASQCETLNHDFTSLSERDRGYLLNKNTCNETVSPTMICCTLLASDTVNQDISECGTSGGENKIMGGVDAGIDDHPWMVLLEHANRTPSNESYRCAGSLINNRYVLTAAHCLKDNDNLTHVHLGKYDWNQTENCLNGDCAHPTVTVAIEEKIIHENYDEDTKENDIALIKLKKIVHYSDFIRPICLPWMVNLTPSPPDRMLVIAGWGKGATSTRKQVARVPSTDFDECKIKYRRGSRIPLFSETQICAGNVENLGACAGDSGGPLISPENNKFTIEGVISHGYNICNPKNNDSYPIVFTKVSSFETWIRESTAA